MSCLSGEDGREFGLRKGIISENFQFGEEGSGFGGAGWGLQGDGEVHRVLRKDVEHLREGLDDCYLEGCWLFQAIVFSGLFGD